MKIEQEKLNERSRLISKLQSDFKTRVAYIQSKVSTLVPSQIRALRLKSNMPRQKDLADAAKLHQSRISMFETPGSNPTIETLTVIAAALRVGLKIEFVPFSEMLNWENTFSQDEFHVTSIDKDQVFLNPGATLPVPVFTQTVGGLTQHRQDTSWINFDVVNVFKEHVWEYSRDNWIQDRTEIHIPNDLIKFNIAITNREPWENRDQHGRD